MWGASAALPDVIDASGVCLQSRYRPSFALTVIARSEKFTWYWVPTNEFSGLPPPREVGANRGSRHVPVHSLSGSIFALPHVSL